MGGVFVMHLGIEDNNAFVRVAVLSRYGTILGISRRPKHI